jgi:hypothetical protein
MRSQYAEILATNRAKLLAPLDMKHRILVKGKVKEMAQMKQTLNRYSIIHRMSCSIHGNTSDRQSIRKGLTSRRLSSIFHVGAPDQHSNRSSRTMSSPDNGPQCLASFTIDSDVEISQGVVEQRVSSKHKRTHKTQLAVSASLKTFSPTSQADAQRMLDKKVKASKTKTDEFYSSILGLRSEPIESFLGHAAPKWALPITSCNEDRFLKLLGLPADQRNRIEGLIGRSPAEDEERQISREIVVLAANPPPSVGQLQRRTARWLIRPYPLG